MVDPLSYFMFQPVLHDWCNKEPLLLIGKSSLCGGSGFPPSISECSFTICLTPYNRKENVLSASLNKTCPSFLVTPVVEHWLEREIIQCVHHEGSMCVCFTREMYAKKKK